jgi:hypothetical protein
MRLSKERINQLQILLLKTYNLDLSDEETQEAGLSIMRFILAKHFRKQINNVKKER